MAAFNVSPSRHCELGQTDREMTLTPFPNQGDRLNTTVHVQGHPGIFHAEKKNKKREVPTDTWRRTVELEADVRFDTTSRDIEVLHIRSVLLDD